MTTASIAMTAPGSVYRARRARLAAGLTRPIVLLAGYPRSRNYPDHTYPFRASSTYLYFGGPPLQGAALLLEPGSDGDAGCVLFRHVQSIDEQVWTGTGPSDDAIANAAGLTTSHLADLEGLSKALKGRGAAAVVPLCITSRALAHSIGLAETSEAERLAIINMRLIKDDHEMVAMRRAAEIGVDAHLAAMHACKPGRTEADVAAAICATLMAHRSEVSFTSIVTIRGDVLHTEEYHRDLIAGRLLLVDAGAEEPGGYASDMTRTYPVDGTFSGIQRQLYDTVLSAERAAIKACTPGRRYRDVHDVAAQAVCDGLVQAGLLKGNPADLFARRAHTLFFTHGVGHLIGLDVHDMEEFGDLAGYAAGRTRRAPFGDKFLRLDRDLEPGYVVTIEPGIYLVPAIWQHEELVRPFRDVVNLPAVEKLIQSQFGGIRLEDTVHVTQGEPEVLTRRLPIDAHAVAAEVTK